MSVSTEQGVLWLGAATNGHLYLTKQSGSLSDATILQWQDDGLYAKRDLIAEKNAHFQGDITVDGVIHSKKAKAFRIPHPLDADAELMFYSLEGPEAGVYFRGQATLQNGEARIALPDYFEALTRSQGRTIQLTAKGRIPYVLSYEDIEDGVLSVYGTQPDGQFSWEVRAVRADLPELEPELARRGTA
jgi:hypothetical protein